MASTVKLRAAIKAKLDTITVATNVALTSYYGMAKDNAPALYAVWSLSGVTADEILDQVELEIYVIGRGDDTTSVENIADAIWSALDHWYYYNSTDNIGFTSYPSVRNVLSEDDKTIIKRRLTFTVRVYGG